MKIGVSHCLLGANCNFNGKDLLSRFISDLEKIKDVEFIPFCPEDSVFGSPRPNLRIVGGDGHDVLDGTARVIDEFGKDVTALQIEGATKFLESLKSKEVEVAILMDGSPSCGSNVLLKEEEWPRGGFKRGLGVAAALLKRNDIKILSSFDELAISEFLETKIECVDFAEGLRNLKDSPKFRSLFQSN